MENNSFPYIDLQLQHAEMIEGFELHLIKATEMMNLIARLAEEKCQLARTVLSSGDPELMRAAIHQYICRYRSEWAHFQGIQIQRFDDAACTQLSEADLARELRLIIALVYRNTALKVVREEAFCESLRELLTQSGVFTPDQVESILP